MSTSPSSPQKKARRCLFGRPDSRKTDAWLKEALDRIREEKEKRWGIDFEHLTPLPGSSKFEYSLIPAATVPEYYRFSTKTPKTINDENQSPSSPEEMDCSVTSVSSVEETPRRVVSPKKRQRKLTDYLPISKKRLNRATKRQRPVADSPLSSPVAV